MEDLTLEWHLTDIEAIAKEVGERPAGERNATDGLLDPPVSAGGIRGQTSFPDPHVSDS